MCPEDGTHCERLGTPLDRVGKKVIIFKKNACCRSLMATWPNSKILFDGEYPVTSTFPQR